MDSHLCPSLKMNDKTKIFTEICVYDRKKVLISDQISARRTRASTLVTDNDSTSSNPSPTLTGRKRKLIFDDSVGPSSNKTPPQPAQKTLSEGGSTVVSQQNTSLVIGLGATQNNGTNKRNIR